MTNQNAAAYFKELSQLLLNTQVTDLSGTVLSIDEGVGKAVNLILSLKSNSGKAMVTGNGGSAAIASHMQNDLCKAVGVPALVFNEPPLLTALANDHGYEAAFERPVKLWAGVNDLLIGISSSGQSESILRAVRVAIARNCHIITLSGFKPDKPLRGMGHINFYISSSTYGYVELAHAVITHFLTDCAMALEQSE